MKSTDSRGRILEFQSAETLARMGAEARLMELLAESQQLERSLQGSPAGPVSAAPLSTPDSDQRPVREK